MITLSLRCVLVLPVTPLKKLKLMLQSNVSLDKVHSRWNPVHFREEEEEDEEEDQYMFMCK